jgi:hypothetical protein
MDTSQGEISALPSLAALIVGGGGIFVVEPFFPLRSQSPYKFRMFIYKIAGLFDSRFPLLLYLLCCFPAIYI